MSMEIPHYPGGIWKRIKDFRPRYPGIIKNQTFTGHFEFVFQETRSITWLSWLYRFRKGPFTKCFLFTRKQKAGVFNSSGFKNVFEKLSFRDGLVWTVVLPVGPTAEIQLRFKFLQCDADLVWPGNVASPRSDIWLVRLPHWLSEWLAF